MTMTFSIKLLTPSSAHVLHLRRFLIRIFRIAGRYPVVLTLLFFVSLFSHQSSVAQSIGEPTEDDYYRIVTLPTPENVLLEVGGLTTFPDGRLALSTRRGDVWVVENAAMYEGSSPRYTRFATGLHEPLGLAYRDQSLYVAQRGELTKLSDTNGDGRADRYETVYRWPLSGHYHEYSYGPKFLPDGDMMVTGNVAFGDEEWWRGESRVPWRGWALRISPDGEMQPWATGMRSPCGLGVVDGEFFYTENQGDWMGSGGVWHVTEGSFTGHPAGLRWTDKEGSPLDLSPDQFYAQIDKRQVKEDGRFVKPENVEEEDPTLLFEAQESFSNVKLPAVWLPHGILGISNSEIIVDDRQGKFGPFDGQLFVGDQGQSKIMRVALEKVKGEYQGVAFDFRAGFQSGVLRMTWGEDGAMYVGETNRGWGSAGTQNAGLERLVWTGDTPFEMQTVRAEPDGFTIEFTQPIDRASAENLEAYDGRSFIYKYHAVYGSPTINEEPLKIKGIQVADDERSVRVVVDNLREHYIHEITVPGIRSADGTGVLHPYAYYTLNNIPDGEALPESEWVTTRVAEAAPSQAQASRTPTNLVSPDDPEAGGAAGTEAAPTFAMVEPLLVKNTCSACHQTEKRQVGPAFRDVAKRGYSDEKIVELIYQPQPQNWPDYTPMAPMPQVPKEEALQIARWINSLK